MTEPMYDQFIREKEYRTRILNVGVLIQAERVEPKWDMTWGRLMETKEEAALLDRLQKAIDLAVAKTLMGDGENCEKSR